MSAVEQALERLRADEAGGALGELAQRCGIDVLTVFGSARHDATTAGDLDLAYARMRGTDASHLDVVNALGERYGDIVDVLDLDRAGSVARYAGLHDIELLVQRTPGRYAELQMRAFRDYCDTQRLRDRVLEVLAG
ncbi:MAG: hypothetical protein Q4G43_11195 [Mobilicoccus sp.]|nr:hypothetical protein [Mobilicoccus sp.]